MDRICLTPSQPIPSLPVAPRLAQEGGEGAAGEEIIAVAWTRRVSVKEEQVRFKAKRLNYGIMLIIKL